MNLPLHIQFSSLNDPLSYPVPEVLGEDDLEYFIEEDREEESSCTRKSVAQIQQQVQQMLKHHYGEGESLDPQEIKDLVLQVTHCSIIFIFINYLPNFILSIQYSDNSNFLLFTGTPTHMYYKQVTGGSHTLCLGRLGKNILCPGWS